MKSSPLKKALTALLAAALTISLLSISTVGISISTAQAETITPTAISAITQNPTPQPSASASASKTPAATTPVTKTPVTKTPVTKKANEKPARKKVRIAPSPKAIWPPKGFTVSDDVYAKLPTPKELVGIISAQKYLANLIRKCDDVVCGSVQVASATGCIWWEVLSTVVARNGRKLGDLKTAHGATNPREIKTFLIISPEAAAPGLKVVMRSVICHRSARDKSNPSVQYAKVELPTPSPTSS